MEREIRYRALPHKDVDSDWKGVITEIEKAINNGKPFRRYTRIDLVKFHKFMLENPEWNPYKATIFYDRITPELTDEQKLENIQKRLDLDFSNIIEND